MAKQPEMTERIRIHGETSKEDFGEYIAVLTKMGMQNLGFELVTDVAAYKERKQHDSFASEAVATYVKDNPRFAVKDLVKHFVAEGRTAGAAYAAVRVLLEKGGLRRIMPGQYQSTDQKALPAPIPTPTKVENKPKGKVAGAKPKSRRGQAPRLAVGNYPFMWGLIKLKTKFTVAAINERFIAAGRNQKSVSPILTKMAQEGVLKNLGDGTWQVVRKPAEGRLAKRAPQGPERRGAKQHVNGVDQGASASPAEGTTNG